MKNNVNVKFIERNDCKDILKENHYLGDKGFRSFISFGLFLEDELIGVAVYHHVSAPETVVGCFGLERDDQDHILELGRMAIVKEYNGKNYASILIGRSLRLLKKLGYKYAISYASSDIHHGYVYQATNWKYYGLTDFKKDFYVWEDNKLRKQERGKTKGIRGVWVNRPSKHRYVYELNGGYDILWEEQRYPKGNNHIDIPCYGCNDEGTVSDHRLDIEYTYGCPICNNGD